MKVIRTVCGDVPPEALGITMAHEHLYCDQRLGRRLDFPRTQKPMVLRDEALISAELADFYSAGGRAVVDATVRGWGRDVAALARISKHTGVHVIATSGYYVEDCLPAGTHDRSVSELEEALVTEAVDGADGTAIRTGLLKSAVSRQKLEGVEARCARAVARAQKRTGLTITTHTSGSVRFQIRGGNAGSMHLDLFESEGVDPHRVIIGHCDENADVRQLAHLIQRGAWVEFDVIGKEHWLLDATRVELLAALVERGYASHLLLASDRARITELKGGGGPGYDHVLRSFVPALRRHGFDDELLRQILVINPAAALSFDPQLAHHASGESDAAG